MTEIRKYVIYEDDDFGRIINSGTDADPEAYLREGLAIEFGTFISNIEEHRFDRNTKEFVRIPRVVSQGERLEHIAIERAHRLAQGFDYDFGDERGVHHIGTSESDMVGWRDVDTMAFKAMARGEPNKAIHIATDSGPVTVKAQEWLDILDQAEQFRQPIWSASFAIQAMDPIPANFADDEFWP